MPSSARQRRRAGRAGAGRLRGAVAGNARPGQPAAGRRRDPGPGRPARRRAGRDRPRAVRLRAAGGRPRCGGRPHAHAAARHEAIAAGIGYTAGERPEQNLAGSMGVQENLFPNPRLHGERGIRRRPPPAKSWAGATLAERFDINPRAPQAIGCSSFRAATSRRWCWRAGSGAGAAGAGAGGAHRRRRRRAPSGRSTRCCGAAAPARALASSSCPPTTRR